MSASGIGAFINGAFAGMDLRERREDRKRDRAWQDETREWKRDDRARADSAWMDEQRRKKAAEEARLTANEMTRRAMDEGEAQVAAGRGAIPAEPAGGAETGSPAPAPASAPAPAPARGRGVSPSLVDETDDLRAARRWDSLGEKGPPPPVSGDAPPAIGVGAMPGGAPPEALGQPGPRRGAMSDPQQLGEAPPQEGTRRERTPPPARMSRPERGRGVAASLVADRGQGAAQPPADPVAEKKTMLAETQRQIEQLVNTRDPRHEDTVLSLRQQEAALVQEIAMAEAGDAPASPGEGAPVPPQAPTSDAAPMIAGGPGYDGAPGTPTRMGRGVMSAPGAVAASVAPTPSEAAPVTAATPAPTAPAAGPGPWVEGTLPGGQPPEALGQPGPRRGARGAIPQPEPAAPRAVRGPLESQPSSMAPPPTADAAPANRPGTDAAPARTGPEALQQTAAQTGLPSVQAAATAAQETEAAIPTRKPGRGATKPPTVTKKQAERAQSSFIDTYMRVGAPIMVEHFITEGQYEQAAAFQEFVQKHETQTAMKHWAKASFAAGIGDLDTFADEIANAYNVRGYFDDDMSIVKDKSGVLYNEEGDATGARVTIRNEETGEEFEQRFDDPGDMVAFGVRMLGPEKAFPYYQEKQAKAQELRAERAKEERERALDLAEEERKASRESEEAREDRIYDLAETIYKADRKEGGSEFAAILGGGAGGVTEGAAEPVTFADAMKQAREQVEQMERPAGKTSTLGIGAGGAPPGGRTADFLGG